MNNTVATGAFGYDPGRIVGRFVNRCRLGRRHRSTPATPRRFRFGFGLGCGLDLGCGFSVTAGSGGSAGGGFGDPTPPGPGCRLDHGLDRVGGRFRLDGRPRLHSRS
jgi:hypothetical protein